MTKPPGLMEKLDRTIIAVFWGGTGAGICVCIIDPHWSGVAALGGMIGGALSQLFRE